MSHRLVGAAIAAMLALPVQAAPFTLFIYEDQAQLDLRPGTDSASQAYWSAYDVYGKDLAAAGVLRGGSALNTSGSVALVTAARAEVASSAYAPSSLALGGYFQIDVPSEADAVQWAQKAPLGGESLIEVRAGYPVPAMMMISN
ncbi:YciI family protein [uncultured Devosia sp.]|uniref:YciI family protein n=1 Tax=uncultured Devosia sp. TaxID=211434 RepID=UPI0035CC2091